MNHHHHHQNQPKIWSQNPRPNQEGPSGARDFSAGFQGPIEGLLSAKQMDKLTKKSKVKQPKLLSSKSLSQLVPRGLFFKKKQPHTNGDADIIQGEKLTGSQNSNNLLPTTKSFPINSTYRSAANSETSGSSRQEQFLARINSASMIGLPRQSSSNSFTGSRGSNNCTMEQPNLSPIVIVNPRNSNPPELVGGENADAGPFDMSWIDENGPSGDQASQKNQGDLDANKEDPRQPGGEEPQAAAAATTKRKVDGSKYKPFKGTTLVLRDVKNSLGLRMKAKHGSQAFARLTNELSTPPTKLYSPFNIYTPDSKDTELQMQTDDDCKTPNNKDGQQQQQDTATVKGRIAFRHKKHLMQANNFSFDSPTGRLRETVKDVEHFQQCIEDISKAIRARDSK